MMIWKSSEVLLDGENTKSFKVKPKTRIEIPTAERDVRFVEIKGRDQSLTKKYGYRDITIPIDFYIFGNEHFKTIYRIAKMKFISAEKLILLDDENIFYKIKSLEFSNAINPINELGEFTVYFTLDPFQYEINNEPIVITQGTTIKNDGHKSLPIITATVAGTGKIYIGDQEVTIKDVNGTITIDSEMQNAYRKSSTITENMNKHMIGEFPVLNSGANSISFDGAISKLEIICNKRWR